MDREEALARVARPPEDQRRRCGFGGVSLAASAAARATSAAERSQKAE